MSKLPSALAENAHPIQNALHFGDGFDDVASTKNAIATNFVAMAFLAPATGIEPITNP